MKIEEKEEQKFGRKPDSLTTTIALAAPEKCFSWD